MVDAAHPVRLHAVPTERARKMLVLALPALVVGIGCSITLVAVVLVANLLQAFLWQALPPMFGVSALAPWWALAVMTGTGFAVGLVVVFAPGHAGPDPATESLVGKPLSLSVLPGLALALILTLAGGVSLGPENPITAICIGLAVALGTRCLPHISGKAWTMLAVAGIVGAMFGTPVAAALLLSEMLSANEKQPLWDTLFAPLIAAASGSITTLLIEGPDFSLGVPPYNEPHWIDLAGGIVVGLVAAVVGMTIVWLFPLAHRLFHSLRHPVLMLTLGGFLLGILGVIGGPITMFKGLGEMKTLAANAGTYTVAALGIIIVVKLLAILIAATCGFRGGRIFPMVFVGVAFGLFAHALAPIVPLPLAVVVSVMTMTLVATRDGWLSLFMAAVMVPGTHLVALLCVLLLPIWLVLADRPQMLIEEEPPGKAA